MKATYRFTKALAIAGTLLVWLPVLAPLVFSVVRLFNRQKFLLDFLMPAELFPVILAGCCSCGQRCGRALSSGSPAGC